MADMAEQSTTTEGMEESYSSLRRLIPELASQLDELRASLREHNVWLQRYGATQQAPYTAFSAISPYNSTSVTAETASTIDHLTTSRSIPVTVPDRAGDTAGEKSRAGDEEGSRDELFTEPPPPRYPTHSSEATMTAAGATSAATMTSGSVSNDTHTQSEPPAYLDPIAAVLSTEASSSHGTASLPTHTIQTAPLLYSTPATPAASTMPNTGSEVDTLPAYGSTSPPPPPFVPPSSNRDQVLRQRDQTIEWLREGEDTLREYSATFAQLGRLLDRPDEDILHTWQESHADNMLPNYIEREDREELMGGGVGELPPDYIGVDDRPARVWRPQQNTDLAAMVQEEDENQPSDNIYGDERDAINERRRDAENA